MLWGILLGLILLFAVYCAPMPSFGVRVTAFEVRIAVQLLLSILLVVAGLYVTFSANYGVVHKLCAFGALGILLIFWFWLPVV